MALFPDQRLSENSPLVGKIGCAGCPTTKREKEGTCERKLEVKKMERLELDPERIKRRLLL